MFFKRLNILILSLGIISFSLSLNASDIVKDKKEANHYKLYGTIIDRQNGEHLAGVLVRVKGTDIKTITDLDGNFLIEFSEPGNYVLLSEYISYRKNITEVLITLNKYHKINILLLAEAE
jgi:outer membrane receptor for ferrienterochelin and colicins